MDKLKIKSEIQEAFSDKTVSDKEKKAFIKKIIIINRIMAFLSNEITIFIFSFIPTLICITYFLLTKEIGFSTKAGIILMIIHFLFYKTIVKGWLLKNSESINEESKYTIEVLLELKKQYNKKGDI
jgi:hypothetical protein